MFSVVYDVSKWAKRLKGSKGCNVRIRHYSLCLNLSLFRNHPQNSSTAFITTPYQTLRYAEVFITFVLNNVFCAIKKRRTDTSVTKKTLLNI